jgi:outer membrane protein TolC
MKKLISGILCAVLLCGTASAAVVEAPEPSTAAYLAWNDLEQRIRSGSLNALVLEENICSIQAIDYEKMYDDLRSQINGIADAQWALILMGAYSKADELDPAYDALRDSFESIKDGTMQADNADNIRQLESAVSQITLAGQTLYLNLISMEQSRQDAQRGLAALDRNLQEMRLRQTLGQVSAQSVAELERTRADTVSQLETLDHTMTTYKMQLQLLIGEEPTGNLELGALPESAEEVLDEMDYEADLAAAKEASWTLRSAQIAFEDAQEDWKDAKKDYSVPRKKYQLEMAEHTWNAAQITYQAAVQDFETSFQTLYRSLSDLRQVWKNKQAEVEYQEQQLVIAQAQYDWGRISRSALLTAHDKVAAARSEAETSWLELFSTLNQYQVAVKSGLING